MYRRRPFPATKRILPGASKKRPLHTVVSSRTQVAVLYFTTIWGGRRLISIPTSVFPNQANVLNIGNVPLHCQKSPLPGSNARVDLVDAKTEEAQSGLMNIAGA